MPSASPRAMAAAAHGGGGGKPAEMGVLGNILLNVLCSVALVSVNKLLVTYGFKYMLLLTSCHFLAGYLLLSAVSSPSLRINLFVRPAPIPVREYLLIAAAGVGSIVLMNYSLRFNSVGTYQILKASQLPITMVLSYTQNLDRASVPEMAAAALVSLGAVVSTASDVKVTLFGLIIGVAGVSATSQYQIWQGTLQSRNKLTSTQALYAISLPQAAIAAVASVLFETAWGARIGNLLTPVDDASGGGGGAALRGAGAVADADAAAVAAATAGSTLSSKVDDIWSHPYSSGEVAVILLTCLLAAGLNYSTIAVIGKTSAVAMQFVNQVKTALIVGMGLMLFPQPLSPASTFLLVAGLGCVFGGVGYYSSLKQKQLAAKQAAVAATAGGSVAGGGAGGGGGVGAGGSGGTIMLTPQAATPRGV